MSRAVRLQDKGRPSNPPYLKNGERFASLLRITNSKDMLKGYIKSLHVQMPKWNIEMINT